jgi:hypothetical protein
MVYEHRVKIFQPRNLYFLALPFGGFSDCTLENKGSQPLTHHLLSKKSLTDDYPNSHHAPHFDFAAREIVCVLLTHQAHYLQALSD